MLRAVQTGPIIGLLGQLAVLSVVAGTVGLGATGWLVGTACGLVTAAGLVHGLNRSGRGVLGAANRVTLTRATLVGGCDRPGGRRAPWASKRSRDGRARRRRPHPRRGGRLGRAAHRNGVSAGCALRHGGRRVLDPCPERVRRSIGRARGCLPSARRGMPCGRPVGCCRGCARQSPPRYWRKPVAAIQGIVLTAAAADQLPGVAITVAIAVAMRPARRVLRPGCGVAVAAAAGSATRGRRDPCSRTVGRLRGVTIVSPSKHRKWPRSRVPPASDEGAENGVQTATWSEHPTRVDETPDVASERKRGRAVASWVITALAVVLLWFSLIFPDQLSRFTPGAFLRLPVEVLILVALGLVLPRAWRRVTATVVGLVLGLVADPQAGRHGLLLRARSAVQPAHRYELPEIGGGFSP